MIYLVNGRSRRGPRTGSKSSASGSPGYTLVELLVSLVAAGSLMAGMAGAIFVSSSTLRNVQEPTNTVTVGTVLDRIANEVKQAVVIAKATDGLLVFQVPDVDGDNRKDTVSYQWSGIAGDPLYKAINHGTPFPVLTAVEGFRLEPRILVKQEQTWRLVESEETLLCQHLLLDDVATSTIDSSSFCGQILAPSMFSSSLPVNAVDWRPTRIVFPTQATLPATGIVDVQLRPAAGWLQPTLPVLASTTMFESDVSLSVAELYEVRWPRAPYYPAPTEHVALILAPRTADSSGLIFHSTKADGGYLSTSDGGATWAADRDRSLLHALYGRYRTMQPVTFSHSYTQACDIAIDLATASMTRHVQLPNHPPLSTELLELDFSIKPTLVDVDADDAVDWIYSNTEFPESSLREGGWTALSGQQLASKQRSAYNGQCTVHFAAKDLEADGSPITCSLNIVRDEVTCLRLHAQIYRQSDASQLLHLANETDNQSSMLAVVSHLPDNVVDVRIIVDPASMLCHLEVNGVDEGSYRYTTSTYDANAPNMQIRCESLKAVVDYASLRSDTP